MTYLKELFTSVNPTPSDVFKEDPRCKTCNIKIKHSDRELDDGDGITCTICFLKSLIK